MIQDQLLERTGFLFFTTSFGEVTFLVDNTSVLKVNREKCILLGLSGLEYLKTL